MSANLKILIGFFAVASSAALWLIYESWSFSSTVATSVASELQSRSASLDEVTFAERWSVMKQGELLIMGHSYRILDGATYELLVDPHVCERSASFEDTVKEVGLQYPSKKNLLIVSTTAIPMGQVDKDFTGQLQLIELGSALTLFAAVERDVVTRWVFFGGKLKTRSRVVHTW